MHRKIEWIILYNIYIDIYNLKELSDGAENEFHIFFQRYCKFHHLTTLKNLSDGAENEFHIFFQRCCKFHHLTLVCRGSENNKCHNSYKPSAP